MPPSNRAAWLPAKQSPTTVVDAAPYTPPSAHELVIRTKVVALNPADVVIQKRGILLQAFPAILGFDVAGEVVEVGSSLADAYAVGDRVIGAGTCLQRKDGAYCYAGFQAYVVLRAPFVTKIPDAVAYEDAAVLPIGINTAASCLFMDATLGLHAPSVDGVITRQGKTLLVWGASSCVGSCGVQMATQAGYEVVGVASERNHEMVRGLGASMCFDQSDATLVDDVVAYLKGKEVVGAYDAISTDPTLNAICEILDRSGGRKLVAAVIPGAETKATRGVKITTNISVDMASSELPTTVWQWLGRAMAENRIQYLPQSEVVGKGLEQVQQAVDLLAKGVSAKKLVVSM
ncbi:hypothetical protein MMC27_003483 [Xylographa pallens]|nr:hypothetical protein [Xylographa pallens]